VAFGKPLIWVLMAFENSIEITLEAVGKISRNFKAVIGAVFKP
jgi:hypothetical protein